MISIQFDDNTVHFSDISYFREDEKEKRIRVPLGKDKEIYLIIKNVTKDVT